MVSRPRALRALAALAALATSGCSIFTDSFLVDDFSGDPFPIDVDTSTGAVVVGVGESGFPDRVGVLDVLSPFTIVDGGPDVVPSISYPDLTVLGAAGPGCPLTRPRAKLAAPQVITLHPCADSTCSVGPDGASLAYGAIIGADALAGDDIRFDLASDQIFIFPNVAGDDAHRSTVCDAVLPAPYRGGGTAIVNGTELGYTGRRITIDVCLAFDPDPAKLQSARGADALFVVSTGIGTSLMGESAYARYRVAEGNAPLPVEQLPTQTVDLPSGPTTGHATTVPSMALVGNSDPNTRGPCRQVYAHHLLTPADCGAGSDVDCPCRDGGTGNANLTFCGVPAIVEMSPPAGFDVLVIPDDDPTLQALRTELRPDQPEVDGILGTSALRTLELDADYPHDRALVRCTDPSCSTRPELPDTTSRTQVQGCVAGNGSGTGSSGPIP